MVDYIFRSGITLAERARSEELLIRGIHEKWSERDYFRLFRQEGLGYAHANIARDIFHAESVGWAKTAETQRSMEARYQELLHPFKEKHHLTRSEMGDIMGAFYREQEIPDELRNELKDFEDMRRKYYEELE